MSDDSIKGGFMTATEAMGQPLEPHVQEQLEMPAVAYILPVLVKMNQHINNSEGHVS